ncbi:hypothetical protein K2Z83_27370 [Oscillochloris sp. ZM17-4]|uniref:RAMP superfamily CRISPR-associated protein n=1 Tax=Oscillochloris sp. ZM17-4 TaxID=2866714 RepID=UPI001C73897F|nr:RAMP superfamily CRISPR-associated protein [Oscillochloris sp. ZM17-4]MBX0331376.1 hypothetical protein [Oscillochloris sp. ZM17-4]
MTTPDTPRGIVTRIVITGDLVLTAPAHLGSGEPADVVDMTLLRDARAGVPLLPGTSLAGALRGELLSRLGGDRTIEQLAHGITALLGGMKGDDDGAQSPLIIEDAYAARTSAEVRDGVKIDPGRRTAHDAAKYDIELLPAGTRFPLRFELLLDANADTTRTRMSLLARALAGLEEGAIRIGARRSRGYGTCRVAQWQVRTYDLRQRAGLLAWLAEGLGGYDLPAEAVVAGTAAQVLGVAPDATDKRHRFRLTLDCAIDGALLVRSDAMLTSSGAQPDFVHLRDMAGKPLLPGTSLAGALRARALRIVDACRPGQAQQVVDDLFGRDLHIARAAPTMSRLQVREALIDGGTTVVQSRVSIDRFTGGALDTALFSEAPQFGGGLRLEIELIKPEGYEIGLLLLLLKDLWTGDLALGGEASVGRGRLSGKQATLTLQTPELDEPQTWTIRDDDGRLQVDGDQAALETYVTALSQEEAADGA